MTGRADAGSPGGRFGHALLLFGTALLCWLAAVPPRAADRLFTMNDSEACWRGWQITRTHGGLGRSYRDPLFDTMAGVS